MGLKLSKSTSAKPRRKAPADSLNADTLDVICAFCDEQTLVSNFAHASKTVASAVDVHAAARARRLWTTSTELERRGVRLGAAFLARRSRPPRRAADGSRIPLASRPLEITPEEAIARELRLEEDWSPDWWAAKKQTLSAEDLARCEPIFGHELDEEAIEEIIESQEVADRQPSALRLPGRVLLVDVVVRDINDRVVGRRSVLVEGAQPLGARYDSEYSEERAWADELHFAESLRIASGLEPDWFWADTFSGLMDYAWLTEVSNVVGVHQMAGAENGRRHICGSGGDVNHKFPEQLREQDYINEYRRSQLPENRRFVSVRVDLFRLSDGKSMCLGEHDVGVKVWWDWPGYVPHHGEANMTLSFIPLVAKGDFYEEESILARPYEEGLNDIFGCQCHAIAEYPFEATAEEGTGELHITGVRLGFCCTGPNGYESSEMPADYQNNPHLGDRVVRSLLTLDAWT